jgi:two-component system sensor histidine kinase SenX3
MLTPELVAVLLAALAVGVALGAWLGRRQRRREPGASVPAEQVGPVLAALRSSAIVVEPDETVVEASPSAYAYGLVRQGRLDNADLASVARAALRGGGEQEGVTTLRTDRRREPATVLGIRAAVLPTGRVLLLLEDRTAVLRTEESRRDFVANISHELKTPVGAITLLSDAVADAADDPEAVRRFAGRLQRESSRLGRIVADIIDLSRLQFDNPVEGARAIPVDAVVAEAMDRCRAAADLKDIRLVRGGPRGLEIVGDKEMLVTAVSNLVENAIAYSTQNTRVAVGVRARDAVVEISVTDQGIGIPENEVERIFERFYRVDPARSRQTGGTGLGLAIVKHIVASHHGEISVWSVPGAGSTFTLRLPQLPSADDAEPSRPAVPAHVPATEGSA